MKNIFRISVCAIMAMLVTTVPAETTKPVIGIVNRTECSSFWRYDFNYETVDADGTTPIVLSAAIFMTTDLHNKTFAAKGCALVNHYTITANRQRPTNVSDGFTLEGVISNSNYFLIESDGFGFGLDSLRNQKYLQGRAAARINIDAFLAGRKLIEEEGFEFGDVTLNLGYSQGGHSAMWVNRLVAEGYRSDELPKIDYCIIGGGAYDMYSHYQLLASENKSQYPVALPLILSGMIDAGGYKVTNEDLFIDDFAKHLPELFDSKLYDTDYINNFIYTNYGDSTNRTLPISTIVKSVFFDENSEEMQDIVYHLKQNSLVYDDWSPNKTDSIFFVHSVNDEIVPFVNQESMKRHLLDNGYYAFDIDQSSEENHNNTGMIYVFKTVMSLANFVPSGMKDTFSKIPTENTHDIYGLDGRLVRKQVTLSEAFRTLPKGIYLI